MGRRLAESIAFAGLLSLALHSGCSSQASKASPKSGTPSAATSASRVLDAIVTEREFDPPGSTGGGSYRGSGSWYLSFEAQDGDRTAHYRFPVTRQQYNRYPEGAHVRLVLDGDDLRDIRPSSE